MGSDWSSGSPGVREAATIAVFIAALSTRVLLLALSHANPDTDSFHAAVAAGNTGLYSGVTLFNYSPGWAQALFAIDVAARAFRLPFHLALGLVYLLVDGLTAWILYRKRGRVAAMLFFFNPVSILASSVYLQFDNISIVFLVLALATSRGARRVARGVVAALLSLSLLIKHVTWFHPLLFIRRRAGESLFSSLSPLVAYAVFALSFIPYWRFWPGIRSQVLEYHSVSETYGLAHAGLSFGLRRAICVLAVLVTVVALRRVELPRASLMLFLVLLLTIPGVWDYYFLWPIAAGAFCGGGVGYAVYSAIVALFMIGSPDGLNLQTRVHHLPDWSGPFWAAVFWLLWEIRRLTAARSERAFIAVPRASDGATLKLESVTACAIAGDTWVGETVRPSRRVLSGTPVPVELVTAEPEAALSCQAIMDSKTGRSGLSPPVRLRDLSQENSRLRKSSAIRV